MLISAVETVDNVSARPGAAEYPVDTPVDAVRRSCASIVHNLGAEIREFTGDHPVIQSLTPVLHLSIHRFIHSCGLVYEIPGRSLWKVVDNCGQPPCGAVIGADRPVELPCS